MLLNKKAANLNMHNRTTNRKSSDESKWMRKSDMASPSYLWYCWQFVTFGEQSSEKSGRPDEDSCGQEAIFMST